MKKTPAKLTAAFAAGIGLVALTCSEYQSQAQTQAPAPSVAPAAEQSETTDFVRFAEGQGEGGGDQLQTVVRSYRRGNTQVDLVAVIHIADPDYYDAMNERLGNYDVVLYEMVGGPFEKRDLQAAEADSSMAGVRVVHSLLQNLLALEYQTEGIDYDNDHFVHADVDWNEYSELMTERNQSMATLFQRAMAISLSGETVPGLPNGDAENVAMLSGLLRAVAAGDANGLKRIVAPLLSEAEALISMIEGDDGTVIISERNKVVMRGVGEQLAAGKKSIGIFYGAGHMPDLEDRLIDRGFEPVGFEWLNAWEIGASPSGAITDGPAGSGDGPQAAAPANGDDAVVNALGFFGKILQDKELMDAVVGGVRKMAEPAESAESGEKEAKEN